MVGNTMGFFSSLLLALFLLGAFAWFTGVKAFRGIFSYAWRHEITIVVDTPNGPVSASSVHKIRFAKPIKSLGEMDRPSVWVEGEAIELPLGERSLFVSIAGAQSFLYRAARTVGMQKGSIVDTVSAMKVYGKPAPMRPRDYPDLVTFRDKTNPLTIREVKPDEMEEVFGPGVTIREITVGRTEKSVDTGNLEKSLGWLNDPDLHQKVKRGGLPYEKQKLLHRLNNHRA